MASPHKRHATTGNVDAGEKKQRPLQTLGSMLGVATATTKTTESWQPWPDACVALFCQYLDLSCDEVLEWQRQMILKRRVFQALGFQSPEDGDELGCIVDLSDKIRLYDVDLLQLTWPSDVKEIRFPKTTYITAASLNKAAAECRALRRVDIYGWRQDANAWCQAICRLPADSLTELNLGASSLEAHHVQGILTVLPKIEALSLPSSGGGQSGMNGSILLQHWLSVKQHMQGARIRYLSLYGVSAKDMNDLSKAQAAHALEYVCVNGYNKKDKERACGDDVTDALLRLQSHSPHMETLMVEQFRISTQPFVKLHEDRNVWPSLRHLAVLKVIFAPNLTGLACLQSLLRIQSRRSDVKVTGAFFYGKKGTNAVWSVDASAVTELKED